MIPEIKSCNRDIIDIGNLDSDYTFIVILVFNNRFLTKFSHQFRFVFIDRLACFGEFAFIQETSVPSILRIRKKKSFLIVKDFFQKSIIYIILAIIFKSH